MSFGVRRFVVVVDFAGRRSFRKNQRKRKSPKKDRSAKSQHSDNLRLWILFNALRHHAR